MADIRVNNSSGVNFTPAPFPQPPGTTIPPGSNVTFDVAPGGSQIQFYAYQKSGGVVTWAFTQAQPWYAVVAPSYSTFTLVSSITGTVTLSLTDPTTFEGDVDPATTGSNGQINVGT